MDRRRAYAIAGAATLTAGAAAFAIGANFGLFGMAAADQPAGKLTVTAATEPAGTPPSGATVQTIVVDVYDTAPGGGTATGPRQVVTPSPTGSASSSSADHEDGEDSVEHEDLGETHDDD